jgi:hypothetical protein
MKVRVYPLTDSNPEYYFEYYFTPEYGTDGRLGGYYYNTGGCGKGWYGSEIFKRDLYNGIVKIIEDITPKKEIKKLSLV